MQLHRPYFLVFYRGKKSVNTLLYIHKWSQRGSRIKCLHQLTAFASWREIGQQQHCSPAAMLIKGHDILWVVLMSTEKLSGFGSSYSKEVKTCGASVAQFLPDKRNCPFIYIPWAKRENWCTASIRGGSVPGAGDVQNSKAFYTTLLILSIHSKSQLQSCFGIYKECLDENVLYIK